MQLKYHNDRLDRIIQQRRDLITWSVLLNYKPAVLSGAEEDTATITTLDGKEQAQFSWPTVNHIVKNHEGSFVS
jgi:hypothetical protein